MINLVDVKKALRITHDEDDAMLTRVIGSALREALAFMDMDKLPVEADSDGNYGDVDIPEDVFSGIILMVQADYDGDPKDRQAYRDAAEQLWTPYRERFVL